MDAVKVLLDKYMIANPVMQDSRGEFANQKIQELYTSLVDQGGQSLISALAVGATIEDLDIKDLDELLAQTSNTDIKIVYQNLAKGSRNHMRAFMGQLTAAHILHDFCLNRI